MSETRTFESVLEEDINQRVLKTLEDECTSACLDNEDERQKVAASVAKKMMGLVSDLRTEDVVR